MASSDLSSQGPSLSTLGHGRYLVFALLYAVQGLPAGFITVAVFNWLAASGASTATVGELAALASLPWALKLGFGPLLDRFQYRPMGRRRPWICGAQLLLVLTALGTSALADPLQHLDLLAWLLFAQATCTALQDVAVDALAIDCFESHELGLANACMFAGKVAGYAAGGAGLAWMLAELSFAEALRVEAVLLTALALVPLLLRERPGEQLLPLLPGRSVALPELAPPSDTRLLLRRVLRALREPNSVRLMGVMLVGVAANVALGAVLKVHFVQQLGWTDTDLSRALALYGAGAAMLGVALSSVLSRWVAPSVILSAILLGLAASAGGFWLARDLWGERWVVLSYLMVDSVLVAAGFVGMNALCMQLTSRAVAASQYAVYMAVQNGAIVLGNRLAGTAATLGLSQLLVSVGLINLAAGWLVLRVKPSAEPARSVCHEATPGD